MVINHHKSSPKHPDLTFVGVSWGFIGAKYLYEFHQNTSSPSMSIFWVDSSISTIIAAINMVFCGVFASISHESDNWGD